LHKQRFFYASFPLKLHIFVQKPKKGD